MDIGVCAYQQKYFAEIWPLNRLSGFMGKMLSIAKAILRQTRGYTLLEVLVAVSILTVGLLAVANLQGAAVKGNNSALKSTIAATVATDRMEKLLALDKDSSLLEDTDSDGTGGLDDTGSNADHALTGQVLSGMSFDIFWNIAPDSPNTGNKTINLIVLWNDNGHTRRLELTQVR